MGPIGPKQLELFGLELWKIAAFDFVYSLTSTNTNQSAPNIYNEYEHKISDELVMGQVIPDQLVFSVLEIEKFELQ